MSQTKKRSFDPNDLNTSGMILWFDDLGTGNDEYRFLSNFYEGEEPITLPNIEWKGDYNVAKDGTACEFSRSGGEGYAHNLKGKPVQFLTGEHAFQALKTRNVMQFFNIATAEDPGAAKHLGRTCDLRNDWEEVKLDVMAAVVRAKFTMGREEGQRLLDTGDRLLVEGTFWYDKVWGVSFNEDGLPGRNWLGTLLMARRAELRALEAFGTVGTEQTDERTQRFVEALTSQTAIYNAEFASL